MGRGIEEIRGNMRLTVENHDNAAKDIDIEILIARGERTVRRPRIGARN